MHTIANRSSWLSGSGNVPACPNGFSVATRKNGIGQRVGHTVDRDLVLFHRLEQRGLRARRRPVHLVDEQDVREHGPGPEVPVAGRRAVHRGAGDVGGQQVGRALHPPEAAADRVRQRLGEQGLAGAGHALDEEVTAREQRDDREPDDVVGAAHRTRHRVEHVDGDGPRVARLVDRRRRQLHIVAQGRPRRAAFRTAPIGTGAQPSPMSSEPASPISSSSRVTSSKCNCVSQA